MRKRNGLFLRFLVVLGSVVLGGLVVQPAYAAAGDFDLNLAQKV